MWESTFTGSVCFEGRPDAPLFSVMMPSLPYPGLVLVDREGGDSYEVVRVIVDVQPLYLHEIENQLVSEPAPKARLTRTGWIVVRELALDRQKP